MALVGKETAGALAIGILIAIFTKIKEMIGKEDDEAK